MWENFFRPESVDFSKNSIHPGQYLFEIGDKLAQASHFWKQYGVVENTEILQKNWEKILKSLSDNAPEIQEVTTQYLKDVSALSTRMLSGDLTPVLEPSRGDRRFRHHGWQEEIGPFYAHQHYLLFNRWVQDLMDSMLETGEIESLQMKFLVRFLMDAWSPSNIPWMNPEAIASAKASHGQTFMKGMENFFQDMMSGRTLMDMRLVQPECFILGRNIAATPGEVIFKNDLIELIQYTPTTKHTQKNPILLVPPCINKFYIYDLNPETSFVKWLLDQGFTVFVISWVNPDGSFSQKGLKDYVFDGVGAAINVAHDICQAPVHGAGFCIGGNLLAMYGGIEKDNAPLASMTFFASLFDFHQAGDLRLFLTPKTLDKLKKQMNECGVLEGKHLMRLFNVMRANDLIWSSVIQQYFLGQNPQIFDFLYWNSDSTNLPSTFYQEYISGCFLDNKMCVSGALAIGDKVVDLKAIKTPVFIINTELDHIAPWVSGYNGVHAFGGDPEFILGGSGHIAGIFNHPSQQKYGFWTNEKPSESSQSWFKDATYTDGSWWPYWLNLLKKTADISVDAPQPGNENYPRLYPAPGEYVKKTLGNF
jgi:polyhydroxyalkanoate synthase